MDSINVLLIYVFSAMATIIACLLTAVLAKPITVLAGMEAAAAALTIEMTMVICIVKPIVWPMAFTSAYGMCAAGDVRFSMIMSATVMWLCRVVIATVLIRGLGFGPMGVWIGMFIDWTVRAVIYIFRFRSRRWATKKVIRS